MMADATTANLALVKPEQGASRDTWGGKTNDNWDDVDAIFKPDGSGTPVGLHIGTGKTLKLDGALVGLPDATISASQVNFSGTELIIGRTASGAGKGFEKSCTAQGFNFLAAATPADARAVIGAAGGSDFTSTDAGSAAGPTLNLYRNSASPADADQLGRVSFTGQTPAPATVEYAAIQANAFDVAPAGSVAGTLDFISRLANAIATRFTLGGGLFARGLTDKGDGTINANALYINGSAVNVGPASPPGSTVQFQHFPEPDQLNITNEFPADTGVPHNTDGAEVMTLTFTPKAANNVLKVEVVVCFTTGDAGVDSGTVGTAGLWLDSATNAVAAACQGSRGGTVSSPVFSMATIHFTYVMTAPSTTPITFKVRAGPGAGISANPGTMHFNNDYGGKSASSISVTEFQA
jgi:hypothetical protein